MKATMSFIVAAAMAASTPVALAKDHDSDRVNGHDDHNWHHTDHEKHLAKGHHKFNSQDHEIAHSWCAEHQSNLPVGLRPADRLAPELEATLHIGNVLDVRVRGLVNPVPVDLARRLPQPPVDLRYAAIGGHVALLDAAHRLHDLMPLPPLPPMPPRPF